MTKINGTSFQGNATLKGNTLEAKDKETKPDTIFIVSNENKCDTIYKESTVFIPNPIIVTKICDMQGKELKTLPDFIENSRTPNSILRSVKPENK